MIRRSFGRLLKEQAQVTVCKDLAQIIAEHMNTIGYFVNTIP